MGRGIMLATFDGGRVDDDFDGGRVDADGLDKGDVSDGESGAARGAWGGSVYGCVIAWLRGCMDGLPLGGEAAGAEDIEQTGVARERVPLLAHLAGRRRSLQRNAHRRPRQSLIANAYGNIRRMASAADMNVIWATVVCLRSAMGRGVVSPPAVLHRSLYSW